MCPWGLARGLGGLLRVTRGHSSLRATIQLDPAKGLHRGGGSRAGTSTGPPQAFHSKEAAGC